MSPPEKKRRRKKKNSSPTTSNPSPTNSVASLPDDLLLSCIARVSRLYYPTLSLVSKRFRSLIASSEYKARLLLGYTEKCLYVCLWGCDQDQWFTLCRKPDQTSNKKENKSSGYVLAKVPIHSSLHSKFPGLVAVGSNIYNIGGGSCSLWSNWPSSSVWILDCTSHTWRKAPSLPVKLSSLSASVVVDRKIYVAGRCKGGNTIQVFDTETQLWEPEPIFCSERNGDHYFKTVCIDGKLHLLTWNDLRVFAYNSKEGRCDMVEQGMGDYMSFYSYCEIENVLYSGCDGLRWYDIKMNKWRKLTGLVGLPPKFLDNGRVRLADYGGKMAVLWQEVCPVTPTCTHIVSCAVIKLERRKSGAIWGKVEWSDQVLRISKYEVVKFLAATV